jgi:hypothetical protein
VVDRAIRPEICVIRITKSRSVRSFDSCFFLDWRLDRISVSMDRAAARSMATPRTIATNSSSSKSDSSAPLTNSIATWNEIDTERSAPIDVSAEAVVPPMPVSAMASSDLRRASLNYETLLSGFAYCQKNLHLRELPASSGGQGKRDRGGACLQNVRGVVFGATIGGILEFVEHPGVKRASMQRRVRAKVTSMAELHAKTQGEDGDLLAIGMASCRLPSKSYRHLPEFRLGRRVDTREGALTTLVGACVALLCAVEVISELDLPRDDVLSPAAEMAACVLEEFRSALPGRGEQAAEARAMRRIASSSRKSWEFARNAGLAPGERLLLQLRNAATAAFPDAVVDSKKHARLLAAAATHVEPRQSQCLDMLPCRMGFVPLAALAATGPQGSDTGSSASGSSWSSTGSN